MRKQQICPQIYWPSTAAGAGMHSGICVYVYGGRWGVAAAPDDGHAPRASRHGARVPAYSLRLFVACCGRRKTKPRKERAREREREREREKEGEKEEGEKEEGRKDKKKEGKKERMKCSKCSLM